MYISMVGVDEIVSSIHNSRSPHVAVGRDSRRE